MIRVVELTGAIRMRVDGLLGGIRTLVRPALTMMAHNQSCKVDCG